MSQFTSLARLPGHFVSFFDDEKVVCSCKVHPVPTVLYFFETPALNAKTTLCRDLLFLEFDGVVVDPDEAKKLAFQAWSKYRERILAEMVSARLLNGHKKRGSADPAIRNLKNRSEGRSRMRDWLLAKKVVKS